MVYVTPLCARNPSLPNVFVVAVHTQYITLGGYHSWIVSDT